MTSVKVCGVRRVEDARRAVSLGARWIGCVLAPDSPRRAELDEVRAVQGAVGADAGVVLVFRGASIDEIERAVHVTGVDRVQLHGAGAADASHEAMLRGLRVHPVRSLDRAAGALPGFEPRPSEECPGVLDYGRGGTGQSFDWSLLEAGAPSYVLIAGGVSPDNVAALLRYHPFGIDVSSGVESEPGVKDAVALERLFEAVRKAS